jgi:hypothetical protein
MGHVPGTTFGIGTPTTFPSQAISWGLPYGGQQFPQFSQPFSAQSFPGNSIGGAQPLQQILQLLQIVPQQLQQLQALQQQQLLQLQQLSQFVPAQLQQLQQLIQVPPQYLQQQQQAYGSAIGGPGAFGLVPQAFAGQGANYVM